MNYTIEAFIEHSIEYKTLLGRRRDYKWVGSVGDYRQAESSNLRYGYFYSALVRVEG
jgi:hypothetical protein